MKRSIPIIAITMLLATCSVCALAQNKYAGSSARLVGITFTNSRNIPQLKGWTFMEGTLSSPLSDPVWFSAYVFKKGTTCIAFYAQQEDTASDVHQILDVVEVKNVKPGYEIRTAGCREYKQENAFVIALVKPVTSEYSKAIKAWFFNRDKIRFEYRNPKLVDCENPGFGE